jgi:hypothetical protein
MYKLTVYIPLTHLSEVKNALFSAGAGKYKNYDMCSFELIGKGQFRPLESANPHIGKCGDVETVDEARVEMIIQKSFLKNVIKALKESHPYEEPAYDIIELIDGENLK